MADVKTENEIMATALKDFGRSEAYAKIVEILSEELEDYRARVLDAQEIETESRALASADYVKYSMQDKVQWAKHFVSRVIGMLPPIGSDKNADGFRKAYERRLEALNSHITRKIGVDYPMYSEMDKLRIGLNFRETFASKDENNPESLGLELDSLIKFYSDAPKLPNVVNTNPYRDKEE